VTTNERNHEYIQDDNGSATVRNNPSQNELALAIYKELEAEAPGEYYEEDFLKIYEWLDTVDTEGKDAWLLAGEYQMEKE